MSTITQFPSGNTQYRIEFDYLARTFVVVTLVNSSNPTMNRVLEVGRDYRFLNPTMIEMLADQSGFDIVRIHRQTGTDLVVDFRNGSVLTASDLTNAELQAIHIAEEGRDQTVDLAKEYADAAGSSAGNAKDSEDEARRIAESIKASGLIGYITRRSFEKGFNVTTWNEVLLWEEDGAYYRWDGTLPKNVPAGSTPETSGGIGLGAWVSVGDAALRTMLALDGGAQYIGNSAITVRDIEVLKSSTWVNVGQFYDLQSYVSLENGGRGYWLAVDTTTVAPNDIDIVQSIAKPEVSFVLKPVNGTVDLRQLGAIGGADVTHILNRAYKIPNVNTIYLSAIVKGEVFKCSNKIVAGKTTIGVNKPVFDFSYCAEGVDAWSYDTGESPSTHNIVYSGFEIRNAKFRGFSGAGNNVIFDKLIIRDAHEQAIGWQGNRWKVIDCQIFGTKMSYDIVIGGVSNDVEVTGCHIEGAVTMGGIEPAYACRNVNIHHNFIRTQPYGVLAWVRTPNGTDKLSTNISINNNIFSEVSKGGVWVRCDETDFNARAININDNLFHSNNADAAFAIRVGGWSGVSISGNTITDYNQVGSAGIMLDDFNGHPTGSVIIKGNTFDTIQQCIVYATSIDGVVIKGNVARNVTYDFIVYPVGNTMANCKVSDNDATVIRDYLRNFSYMSARHVRNNSFKLPLASVSQLNGASVLVGDKFLLYPPVSGSAEGFVCTTSGVVGTNAVFKNLPTLP